MEAREQSMIEALRDGLREEMQRDDRVVLLGEDIGAAGGIFQATDGLRREFGRGRVWDMPLAESGVVGISIGVALGGLRPVAEIQFADFLLAAMHQIVNEAAKMRYRSRGAWTCPIVIRAPFGGGVGGGPDHSQSVEAFFAHIPGLKVVIPSTPADIKGLIKAAIRDEDPVIFLEPKRLYRERTGAVPVDDYVVPLGQAVVRRVGKDVSVITYGAMVAESLLAAEQLAGEGIAVEVVDVRTLQPLDFATITASVRKTNHAIVFHEDTRFAGFGAEIAAFIAESCFEDLDGPVMRVGAVDLPIPANPQLEQAVLPMATTLMQAVHHLAAY
jgi:2-oxoisovalerate dehydrogenase E1 component beta subunit